MELWIEPLEDWRVLIDSIDWESPQYKDKNVFKVIVEQGLIYKEESLRGDLRELLFFGAWDLKLEDFDPMKFNYMTQATQMARRLHEFRAKTVETAEEKFDELYE